jgi:hypothetical protein
MTSRAEFSSIVSGEIDHAAATISGVSVITIGEAKGHSMLVDAQSLAEVMASAETYAGGLKVKTDHYTGFNEIVGALRAFRMDGDQLRADLHLLKSHPAAPRILEMAETMPDSFGLSIAFTGQHEDIDGQTFARCSEIYSADLVDAPAANPSGLFAAKVDSPKKGMDEKQFAEALAAALAPINEKLSAFDAFVADATAKLEAMIPVAEVETEDDAPVAAEVKPDEAMSAVTAELAEIKALVKNFGAKPLPAAPAPAKADAPADVTTFEQAIAAARAEGLTGTAATKAAMTRFPDLYRTAREQGIRNL